MQENQCILPEGSEAQNAESLDNSPQKILDILRVKATLSASEKTLAGTLQALDSFTRFIGGAELTADDFDETLLGEWAAHLLFNGYTLKTTAYYIKRLGSLYSKVVADGMAPATEAFSTIKSRLAAPAAMQYEGTADKRIFHKLQQLFRDKTGSPNQLAKDMLLFGILNGGLSAEEIASYKKDDYQGSDKRALEIVERYSKPKNRYLFPLDHSTKSASQLVNIVSVLWSDLLDKSDIKVSVKPADAALDLWCMVAKSLGHSATDIAGCVGTRLKTNFLTAYVRPATLSQEQISAIQSGVAEALTDDPINWYVMRFRRKVTYEMISDRFNEKNIHLPEIYYPMEEILHKTGNKKVFERRPVISWLMFFRERPSELNNLYQQIGDLAWGYRSSRDFRSPYAVISRDEIRHYQQAIGTFSSDTELFPEGTLKLNPGDRLLIIGGLLNGHLATFESMVTSKKHGNKTVCRLILDGGPSCEWIADQDPRLLQRFPNYHNPIKCELPFNL